MKTERRHELQHNTLDAELGKGVEFFRRHVGTLLWAAVIFLAVLLGSKYVRQRMQARDLEYRNAFRAVGGAMREEGLLPSESIERLRPIADQTRDEAVAIEALFMMASLNIEAGAMQLMPELEAMGLADELYQEVIERFSHHPIQVANAHIGLATLAENVRDFDKAAEHYRLAIAVDGAAGSPAVAIASQYSSTLASLRRPLGMTPPKMPEPIPTSVPGDPGAIPGAGAPTPLPITGDGAAPEAYPPSGIDESADPFGPITP